MVWHAEKLRAEKTQMKIGRSEGGQRHVLHNAQCRRNLQKWWASAMPCIVNTPVQVIGLTLEKKRFFMVKAR